MLTEELFTSWLMGIILIVMLAVLYGLGAALFGAAALLFGMSFQENIRNPLLLRILSGMLFVGSVYLFVRAYRHGIWQERLRSLEREVMANPPPDPLFNLLQRIIRWVKNL